MTALSDLLDAVHGLPAGAVVYPTAGQVRAAGLDVDPEIPDCRAVAIAVADIDAAAERIAPESLPAATPEPAAQPGDPEATPEPAASAGAQPEPETPGDPIP